MVSLKEQVDSWNYTYPKHQEVLIDGLIKGVRVSTRTDGRAFILEGKAVIKLTGGKTVDINDIVPVDWLDVEKSLGLVAAIAPKDEWAMKNTISLIDLLEENDGKQK